MASKRSRAPQDYEDDDEDFADEIGELDPDELIDFIRDCLGAEELEHHPEAAAAVPPPVDAAAAIAPLDPVSPIGPPPAEVRCACFGHVFGGSCCVKEFNMGWPRDHSFHPRCKCCICLLGRPPL